MYYENEDITMYYEKYGDGKGNIIILPGWGDTRNTFSYMIDFLKQYFTVYIMDYPGFGNSPFPNRDLTLYDYTELIHEWILEQEIINPILIGHSFGGRIITTLLGYYNFECKNIILMNSAGIKPKQTLKKKLRSSSYHFLNKIAYILPKKIQQKFKNYLFSKFASADYRNLTPNMRNTFKNIVNLDLSDYLLNIKARTLIISGNQDTSTPLRDAYIFHNKIKNSELIVIDKTDHFTYLRKPYLINQIIFEQLKDEI